MSAGVKQRVAVVYPSPPGLGGSGYHADTVITALANGDAREVHAFGPPPVAGSLSLGATSKIVWHEPPRFIANWRTRLTPLRWRLGRIHQIINSTHSKWAAAEVRRLGPDACYVFGFVGLKTLQWSRQTGAPAFLDSAMGHPAHYSRVSQAESLRWLGRSYNGFPSHASVRDAELEYSLAPTIRVSSQWARKSLARWGVEGGKVSVIPLPLDLVRFVPADRVPSAGPLRICYVGALNLAKGFTYLLRAVRALGPGRASLRVVGSTGDRWCRQLFQRERAGLDVAAAPGDPLSELRRAEILVLPSLHDGFGLVVAEAMACGLPVIATDQCGASELLGDGVTGWVVPAGDAEALVVAFERALRLRDTLPEMGRRARAAVELFNANDRFAELRHRFYCRGTRQDAAYAQGA